MEVFIRGLPSRQTERSLNSFFDCVLSRRKFEDWSCQKSRGKSFANLLFLRPEDGERFLTLHRQTTTGSGCNLFLDSESDLRFKWQSLRCNRSTRKLDVFAVRSLEMESKARAKNNVTAVKADRGDSRTLACVSISCGIWEYTQSGILFQPFFTLKKPATITCNSKAIVVQTDNSQRLEIISQTVESIIWDGSMTNTLTLTMRETPRISVCPNAMRETSQTSVYPDGIPIFPLGDFLASFNSLFFNDFGAPNRNRALGLDQNHEEIAGCCFVYQFIISEGIGLKDLTKGLGLTRGLPPMVQRHIRIGQTNAPYTTQLKTLLKHLTPRFTTLPYGVGFQLQKLAQNGYLPPSKVVDLLPEVKNLATRSGSRVCVNAIRRLFRHIPYAGPDTEADHFSIRHLTKLLEEIESELILEEPYMNDLPSSDQTTVIHRATVTPCGIYLDGPDRECNNRILRKYSGHHEFFLRVQFCDEDWQPVQYNRNISNEPIYERFKSVLNNGFSIAGRHFSFLGFSHSSLRSQSCWFVAPFTHNGSLIYYNDIIKDLGNFSGIRIPAKCAARIGQAFSDTRDAITLPPGIVKNNKELLDVKRNGRVFSDGVGTISQEALKLIWDKLLRTMMKPTILQIRYQGAKGVIALDSRLKGKSVFIRDSMTKFRGSTSNDVEICTAAYKPIELRLNEQLIKILEDMGVRPQFFLDLQSKEIRRLQSATTNTGEAAMFLESQSIGQSIYLPEFLRKLPQLQLSFQDDDFLRDLVETAVLIQLRTLKYKARIPVKHGFTLLGIMDETGILEEGEIFCIVDDRGRGRVITGKQGRKVIITRSPALHPGDVQLATAVAVPEDSPLMQLRNCICFSQKGSRDLPSMLSGGDLDGDLFQIIFDPKAEAQDVFLPADYAKQTPLELGRPVERKDMAEFFVKFMETDQLGRICNTHKMLADQSDEGVNDDRCIKLAEMASTAVDFSKSAIPVEMSEMPRYSRYRPHFMAPGPHVEIKMHKPISFDEVGSNQNTSDGDEDSTGYKYYHSDKILGRLFDAIDEKEVFEHMEQNCSQNALHSDDLEWDGNWSLLQGVWSYTHDRFLSAQWKLHLDQARSIRNEYEDSLLDIMFEFGPRPHLPVSEVEVFIGNILGKTGALTTYQRELCISMKERFEDLIQFTVKWIRSEEYDTGYKESRTTRAPLEQRLGLSMACLWVALNEKAKSWKSRKNKASKLRSFGYVAAAMCLTEVEHIS